MPPDQQAGPRLCCRKVCEKHLLSNFCNKARLRGMKHMQEYSLFAMQPAFRSSQPRYEMRLKAHSS